MRFAKKLVAFAFAMGSIFVAGTLSADALGTKATMAPLNHQAWTDCGSCHKDADPTDDNQGFEVGNTNMVCSNCHSSQSTADGDGKYEGANDTTPEVPAFMPIAGTDEDGNLEMKDHRATCGDTGISGGCHDNDPEPDLNAHYSSANIGPTANCNECHKLEPTKADSSVTIEEDNVLPGNLNNNITPVTGSTYTFAVGTAPSNGVLVVDADGDFTYTPVANFAGTDTFVFTVTDEQGYVDYGAINITVTAVNDVIVAPEEGNSTVVTGSVVEGDLKDLVSDVEGDPLTFSVKTDVAHGTLVLNADGTFTYTPEEGFIGEDSFTYSVTDGVATVDGTYLINVTAPPVDTDNDGQTDDVDADDDNDGFSDTDEASAGTDPLDATSFPVEDNPTPVVDNPIPVVDKTEEPVSTNPKTGGNAVLMLSLAVTTAAGAGMVVFRKRK